MNSEILKLKTELTELKSSLNEFDSEQVNSKAFSTPENCENYSSVRNVSILILIIILFLINVSVLMILIKNFQNSVKKIGDLERDIIQFIERTSKSNHHQNE